MPASLDRLKDVPEAARPLSPAWSTEARVAADGGDAATCLALRAPRTALVDGLTTRPAQLPRLVVVARSASLPALLGRLKDIPEAVRLGSQAWRSPAWWVISTTQQESILR